MYTANIETRNINMLVAMCTVVEIINVRTLPSVEVLSHEREPPQNCEDLYAMVANCASNHVICYWNFA